MERCWSKTDERGWENTDDREWQTICPYTTKLMFMNVENLQPEISFEVE